MNVEPKHLPNPDPRPPGEVEELERIWANPKGWRIIGALGPAALFGAALRLWTLDRTLASVGKRLGLTVRMVELANPLAAVDVDKPDDHQLVTAILEGRA